MLNASKVVCYVDLIPSLEPLGPMYLYESEVSHRNINSCQLRFISLKAFNNGHTCLVTRATP